MPSVESLEWHNNVGRPKVLSAVGKPGLPAGAPFGAVAIDTQGCTLCLACAAVLSVFQTPAAAFSTEAVRLCPALGCTQIAIRALGPPALERFLDVVNGRFFYGLMVHMNLMRPERC
jgi:hypothetical protein